MKFLNDYNIEVAGINVNEKDDELFWKLVYKKTELSKKEIEDLGRLLI